MQTQTLQIQNQTFVLHPSGVLFWEEKSILLISDVHLGKVSHFRKFGAAVPQNAIQSNFDRMDDCIAHFEPNHLIFMGDLFHSALNKEWQMFEKWTSTLTAEIVLVAGNHDIISPVKYEDIGIRVVSEIQLDGFLLTHHPDEREGFFNFCGHVHPAIRLTGLGRQSARLRCFFKSERQMILPAFGEFTGSYTLEPEVGCEVFALLGDTILPVPIVERKKKRRFSR
ncbi:MAG: ligase-associated DNA damage response endonuclease PdeM [Pricia sp.]